MYAPSSVGRPEKSGNASNALIVPTLSCRTECWYTTLGL